MKTIKFALGALALALAFNAPLSALATGKPGEETPVKTTTLTVDPAKSSIVWTAKKVGGEHTGNVNLAKGTHGYGQHYRYRRYQRNHERQTGGTPEVG
jgi:polyisoprenoid-binding protein YceI